MHHARHRQIHAVGAAIMERVRDAMREESAGSGTEHVFFRHPATRQQGMPWHGLVGRRGFCFAPTRPLAQGNCPRAGFWPGSRGRTCWVGTCNSRQRKFHLSGGHPKHRQQAYCRDSSRRNHRQAHESKIRIRRLQNSLLRIAISLSSPDGTSSFSLCDTGFNLNHGRQRVPREQRMGSVAFPNFIDEEA
jgi:hypothetical protein